MWKSYTWTRNSFHIYKQEESKYIHEQLQKELDDKAFEEAKEKTRANKNKIQDKYMSVHFEYLKTNTLWEWPLYIYIHTLHNNK